MLFQVAPLGLLQGVAGIRGWRLWLRVAGPGGLTATILLTVLITINAVVIDLG